MKFSSFDKLLNVSKDIEDTTQGEQCGVFGNNVNAPADNDISEYNKGVGFMTYGNYNVPLNESVDYVFNVDLLHDNLNLLKAVMQSRLDKINKATQKQRDEKGPDLRNQMTAGFLQNMGADNFSHLLNEIELDEQGVVIPQIDFDIDDNFYPELRRIYKTYFGTEEQLNNFIANARSLIQKYDIKTWSDFITKINHLHEKRISHSDQLDIEKRDREQKIDKFVGDVFNSIFNKYSDEELESNIEKLAEKEAELINQNNKWYRTNIRLPELLERVQTEITAGGRDIETLKKLYKDLYK